MSAPARVLVIIADQFTRDLIGCYGGTVLRTPHLDALAHRGVCFERAYTPCPICVPARAALATGRHVHQIGCWDNGHPYAGQPRGWAHALGDAGVRVESFGKLHFRREGDAGFTREHQPMHVVDGTGDVLSGWRDDPAPRPKRDQILQAGPGNSAYQRYDRSTIDAACAWLAEDASVRSPWCWFVSLACPHPPYLGPPELFAHYLAQPLPRPPQWREADWPQHPALRRMRALFEWKRPFTEAELQRLGAAYYAAAEFVDQQVGRLLAQLDALGLDDTTDIVFTSDHGESLGARGLFGKFTMYEESVAVPLLAAGPTFAAGKRCATPVSLIDLHPTILETFGLADAEAPGTSLRRLAREPDQARLAFSEYHALHSRHAVYLLTDGRHKYVHYTHESPQLFDLTHDPREEHDLAATEEGRETCAQFERDLRARLDPEATDQRAKADQQARIAARGGLAVLRQRGYFADSPVPGERATFHPAG